MSRCMSYGKIGEIPDIPASYVSLGWLVDTWLRGSCLQNLFFFRGDRFLAVRVLEQSVRNWLQELAESVLGNGNRLICCWQPMLNKNNWGTSE